MSRAVEDLSFEMRAGETVALVGEIRLRQEHGRARAVAADPAIDRQRHPGRVMFEGRDLLALAGRANCARCAAAVSG